MTSNAVSELRQALSELSVRNEQDLLEYIPLAARLNVLGDSDALKNWHLRAEPFKDRVGPLLVERGREGIWDLQQAFGEDLGLAIIDAQDFHCFRLCEGEGERNILPPEASRMLLAWAEEAEETSLDEDAAETLRHFIERFPLPEEQQLAVVHAPVTEFMEAVVASQARARPMIELQWESKRPEQPKEIPEDAVSCSFLSEPVPLGELYVFDSGTPSDRLKREFEKLDQEVKLPGIGDIWVSRRVNDELASGDRFCT